MPRDGTKNLIPQNRRTKDEQKTIARKGGVASGKARREKRLMSQIFAERLSDGLDSDIEKVLPKIIRKGGPAAVSLMKIIAEVTEGNKHILGSDPDKPFDMTINIIGVKPSEEK